MERSSENGGLRDALSTDARTIGDAAKGRVQTELNDRKGMAAQQANSVASALETAAGELGEGSPDWLRSAFRSGSRTLQQMADTIDDKSAKDLTRDVQQLARDNPVSFLGVCALAGFAAARVMKAGAGGASNEQDHSGQGSHQEWQANQNGRRPPSDTQMAGMPSHAGNGSDHQPQDGSYTGQSQSEGR